MNQELRNNYLGIRHGQSRGNVEKRVVSTIGNGGCQYGLTRFGVCQVQRNVWQAVESKLLRKGIRIIASDFLRAHQTAEIARMVLEASGVELDEALRERNFGDYEMRLKSEDFYTDVWGRDVQDPNHTDHGVEAANQVRARILNLVQRTEALHQGQTFLFSAHGDTLQIAQTAFEGRCSSEHRELKPWENAEVRQLGSQGDTIDLAI